MITLGTGLPGNGKTLFMLWYLKKKADRENRDVYYYNVKNLNTEVLTNWKEFDPLKWYELPPNSLVFMDECQDIFGKKPNGATVPEHFSKLNTHRHLGIDLFLITQHPGLIDNSVRLLVGQHFHSIRKFGMQRATIYEWSAANASPQLASSQKNAIPMKWTFPKEVFTWYKSAEVHTVKRSIPGKLILACMFVVGVFGYGYYALDRFQQKGIDAKAELLASQQNHTGPVDATGGFYSQAGASAPKGGYANPVEDAKEYMFNQTPRVESLPETAPKYDPLTVPIRVPVPAMCVQIGSVSSGKEIRCKCYTQQATPLDIEFNMCISIARNGRFMDFDPDPVRREEQTAQKSAQTLQAEPDVPLRQNYGAPQVIAFNEVQSPSIGVPPVVQKDDGPPNRPNVRTATVPAGAAP